MENFVITIARQYGSGGRTVGQMLAKRLGVPFYGKEIIQMASDESGIDVKLFGQVEEGTESLCEKYVDQVIDVIKAKGHTV